MKDACLSRDCCETLKMSSTCKGSYTDQLSSKLRTIRNNKKKTKKKRKTVIFLSKQYFLAKRSIYQDEEGLYR